MSELTELKEEILALVRAYSEKAHSGLLPAVQREERFVPGESVIPYAGRVFGPDEVAAAVGSALDFWLTLGENGNRFQKSLARTLGVRKSLLVNSGSSANLLALSALTSHKLPVERRILPGDEVITCAAGFPTTVAPILQNGAVPVFLDNDPVTGNIDTSRLEEALIPGKTKAVMLAHALGNPFDVSTITAFCKKHQLWLIEDNCDALGSEYSLPDQPKKKTGSFGDLSTQSFYPPHHITLGEGGAVNVVSSVALYSLVESFRDWGRDCWCESGKDNTCGQRFDWKLGELPEGYDHKYIYSHLGYNLKPLDLQAAIGLVQLDRLQLFVEERKRNWETLREGLSEFEEFFSFSLPTHAKSWSRGGFSWDDSGCKTECSWFGFLLLVRESAPFSRSELAKYLDSKKIGHRMFFGGNLVRQPAFVELKRSRPQSFRVVGELRGADQIMNEALFLGVYPGLSGAMIEFVIDSIGEFVRSR